MVKLIIEAIYVTSPCFTFPEIDWEEDDDFDESTPTSKPTRASESRDPFDDEEKENDK